MSFAFQAEGLTKTFGKTTALAGVDLAARPGSILGVLGPNVNPVTHAINAVRGCCSAVPWRHPRSRR
jgi:oleandomycin transport system ATP-binding protein